MPDRRFVSPFGDRPKKLALQSVCPAWLDPTAQGGSWLAPAGIARARTGARPLRGPSSAGSGPPWVAAERTPSLPMGKAGVTQGQRKRHTTVVTRG
jgi:hypothetical protein